MAHAMEEVLNCVELVLVCERHLHVLVGLELASYGAKAMLTSTYTSLL